MTFALAGCGSDAGEDSINPISGNESPGSATIEPCTNGIEENLSIEEFAVAWGDAVVTLDTEDLPPEKISEARNMAETGVLLSGHDDLFTETPPSGQKNYLLISCREWIGANGAGANTGPQGLALLLDGYNRCFAQKTLSPNIDELDDPELRESFRSVYGMIEKQVAATWTHLCPQFTPEGGGW